MSYIEFVFPGEFNASLYPELIADPSLSSIVYTRFLYSMGSLGRTGALMVTTKFDYNDQDYKVHVRNPKRLNEFY